jgi:hypothetical protein
MRSAAEHDNDNTPRHQIGGNNAARSTKGKTRRQAPGGAFVSGFWPGPGAESGRRRAAAVCTCVCVCLFGQLAPAPASSYELTVLTPAFPVARAGPAHGARQCTPGLRYHRAPTPRQVALGLGRWPQVGLLGFETKHERPPTKG